MSGRNEPYFVDNKRGEVKELRVQLRDIKLQRDPKKYSDVLKKVIAYMTLGIDVSPVFSEMVMASSTRDLVQKKMIHHYLCTYAVHRQDVAILAINTLRKDCTSEDPMVRGLALRSLCGLRLNNIVEHVMQPIQDGLRDPAPYVRKAAVLGVAKVFRVDPKFITESSDLVTTLYGMLTDKNTAVITAVIRALSEILAEQGGIKVTSKLVLYLLPRIREFNEWGQCELLEVVARWRPKRINQMFEVMTLLEDRLQHSNAGVVLATTKVFLNFTQHHPQVAAEVFQRLKPPLLTLVGSSSVEISYGVLAHVETLIQRAPGVFDESYKSFYVRFNDPIYVKVIKVRILCALANQQTGVAIMNELGEYVTDVAAEVAELAIQSIAKIALRLESSADDAIELLLSFLGFRREYVSSATCIVMKDILRRYPDRYEVVIPALQSCLKTVESTAGKAAVIWMIGEYGDTIKDAPYILEPLIDAFEDETSDLVRIELLTATTKLFFKRPPELQKMLGRLLKAAVENTSRIDVRDRALLYYRLLGADVQEAARVINCAKVEVESFDDSDEKVGEEKRSIDEEENELEGEGEVDDVSKSKVGLRLGYSKGLQLDQSVFYPQFNTLAVMFGVDEATFASTPSGRPREKKEGDQEVTQQAGQDTDATPQQHPEPLQPEPQQTKPSQTQDEDLNIFGGAPSSQPSETKTASFASGKTLSPQQFQQCWGTFTNSVQLSCSVHSAHSSKDATALMSAIETASQSGHLATIAAGVVDGVIKSYLYAALSGDGDHFALIELLVHVASGQTQCTVKVPNGCSVQDASQILMNNVWSSVFQSS